MKRPNESALVGAAGALISGGLGSLVGLAVPAAIIGGLNGAISGWRRVYRWSSPTGWLAMGLDSSWAMFTTTAAVAAHLFAAVRRDSTYSPELSERQNRHVYGKGFRLRPNFAITYGNTVCGAGDPSNPRCSRLVRDHENVHVWQSRWFGPFFPVLYGLWMGVGAVAGATSWVLGRRRGGLFRTVETFAYYSNPFEWWAYSRDACWPPAGKVDGLGPRRPMVKAFADSRRPSTVAPHDLPTTK